MAMSPLVMRAKASSNKFLRGGAKAFQFMAYPGALSAQLGAAVGAFGAERLVDLHRPDGDVAYVAAKLGAGVVGGVVGGVSGGKVSAVVNRRTIAQGAKEFERQLITQEFSDIELGRFSRQGLIDLNDIRFEEGVELMKDNRLMATGEQVKHIYEGRVKEGKMTPKDVVEIIKGLVGAKKLRVAKGNSARNQEISFALKGARSAYVAYVSFFDGLQRTGLVTAMKKGVKRLKK